MQFLDTLLQALADKGSDLYLSVGSPPMMKIGGCMATIGSDKLKASILLEMAKTLLGQEGVYQFQTDKSANFAHSVQGVGRFRVNAFFQRNEISFVIRAIRSVIPTLEELRLPSIIGHLALEKRGLILFVGATGSGKSTSLAALIQHRTRNEAGHILTIEDPIEFLHTNAKSLVNQREIGIDAVSYQDALENALRQAPDVILMGEVRARETMDHAVAFAETGHLCLSTLHANNANQAIDRIINFFPAERRNQLLMDLALNMKAIISQRLLPTMDGRRGAAVEVLINTPRISDLILKGDVHLLKDAMEKGAEYGMRTFDQAMLEMVLDGRIDEETALKNADSANNLRLMIREKCPAGGGESQYQKWEIQ